MKPFSFKRHLDRGQLIMLAASLLLLLALLLFLPGGEEQTPAAAPTPFPAPEGLRIAVASDLHLDPDNRATGPDAPETAYSLELVDALLYDAKQQGAAFLLLTGDLVNGGKVHRHEALIEKLRDAEDAGLPVYVLPGNHDLAPVGQQDFARLYGAFGYEEAYSRDESSLSYCVLRDDLMLLLLDTGGYSISAIDLPGAHTPLSQEAFFSEATLRWAESLLQTAREKNLTVLCAGHYNLLTELSRQPGSGYYVKNGDRLAALLKDYGVPLYLSGHMHLRAVYQEDGLTELLTEYLLGYPTGYSVLDLKGRHLRYLPRRIDVDAWAKESGQRDPVLLDFARWQQEGLRSYSRSNVSYMAERNPLSAQEAQQAADFFYAVMNAYWDGSLYRKRDALRAMPGSAPFFRCAQGYSYGWWLQDLLDQATPLTGGFTLDW